MMMAPTTSRGLVYAIVPQPPLVLDGGGSAGAEGEEEEEALRPDAGVPPPPLEPRHRQLPAAPGAPLLRRSHGRGFFPGGRGRGRVGEARVEEAPAAGAAVERRRLRRLRRGRRRRARMHR